MAFVGFLYQSLLLIMVTEAQKKRTIHVPHGSLSIPAPAKDKHAPKGYL